MLDSRVRDCAANGFAVAAILAVAYGLPSPNGSAAGRQPSQRPQPEQLVGSGDSSVSMYAGAPVHHRSNVHIVRHDATNITLHQVGWDGDAFHFPIDGGVRFTKWRGTFGATLDFFHNKAIARLGYGAHGRKLADPIVEEVSASGTWRGQPSPPRLRLTELLQRLEFTHGHNLLLFTALFRPLLPTRNFRPYIGVGGGMSLPHVEVRFSDSQAIPFTSQYQVGGPAAQFVAGIEINTPRATYFVEYKLTWAYLSASLTGEQSRLNFDALGDVWQQLIRWWRRDTGEYGSLQTTIVSHQIVAGAGPIFGSPQK